MPDLQLSDGLVIHYVDAQFSGSPPVLLLHGLGVNSKSWGMQVPALERAGFRILMPDIRGFGKSTFPGGSVTVRRLASDIVLLLHNLHIPSTVVVGISMGGALALQMALDNPELVSRLILINTFSHLRPKRVKTWVYFAVRFAMLHIIGLKAQAHAVATHLFPSPADAALREIFYTQISQADPAGYRAAMRALARFNVSRASRRSQSQHWLSQVRMTTLFHRTFRAPWPQIFPTPATCSSPALGMRLSLKNRIG